MALQFIQRIPNPSSTGQDLFGHSIALSKDGKVLVIGTPYADIGANTRAGYVYVYRRSASGQTFSHVKTIAPPVEGTNYYHGYSVACDNDGSTIFIGMPGKSNTGTNRGGVYIWDWGGSDYTLTHTYEGAVNSEQVGFSVACNGAGTSVIMGAPYAANFGTNRGKVYKFDYSSGWPAFALTEDIGYATWYPSNSEYMGWICAMSENGLKMIAAGLDTADSGTMHMLSRGGIPGAFSHLGNYDFTGTTDDRFPQHQINFSETGDNHFYLGATTWDAGSGDVGLVKIMDGSTFTVAGITEVQDIEGVADVGLTLGSENVKSGYVNPWLGGDMYLSITNYDGTYTNEGRVIIWKAVGDGTYTATGGSYIDADSYKTAGAEFGHLVRADQNGDVVIVARQEDLGGGSDPGGAVYIYKLQQGLNVWGIDNVATVWGANYASIWGIS